MPYVEMGQGTITSIPMLIAGRVEVNLKQVRLEHAPPNEKLYVNPPAGRAGDRQSNAMRGAWKPLREAGAARGTRCLVATAPSLGRRCKNLPRAGRRVVHVRPDVS